MRLNTQYLIIIILSAFGLAGCATNTLYKESSPVLSTDCLACGAIRIEVPLISETLLDRMSVGSGFLLSRETGVTCAHVLAGRAQDKPIKAYIAGQEYDLEVIGIDSKKDIAVFRITPMVPAGFVLQRECRPVIVGQSIRVIGCPLASVIVDKMPSVTGGIISGVNRSIKYDGERIDGLIQADAVTSQGSSGGPIITTDGKIIGMVVFAATGINAEWRGATFAFPIKLIETIAQDIIKQNEREPNQQNSAPPRVKDIIN